MATMRSPTVVLATLGFAVLELSFSPGAAYADDEAPPVPPEPQRAVVAAEILESMDLPEHEKGWLSTHLERMRLHQKYGFVYRHTIDAGEKPMRFTVRGPVLRKGLSKQRAVGLSFEVRF